MDAVEVLRALNEAIEKAHKPRVQIIASRPTGSKNGPRRYPVEDVRFDGARIAIVIGDPE